MRREYALKSTDSSRAPAARAYLHSRNFVPRLRSSETKPKFLRKLLFKNIFPLQLNLMKIFVKAKPNSSEEKVEKIDEKNFVVSVKEPPVNGLANKAIIKALSDFLGVHPARIKIISGYTSKQKIIEIE